MAPEKNTDAVYDASTLEYLQAPAAGRTASVRHVRRNGSGSRADRPGCGQRPAVCGPGHAAVPPGHRAEDPRLPGLLLPFIGGYNAIRALGTGDETLPYACFGVACAGLVYLVLAFFFKQFGAKKVMRYFPPIVTGPIIICIGLTLSGSAVTNCSANWWVALVAILIVVCCNIWGKGMIKIIPILLGVVGSYVFSMIVDPASREHLVALVSEADWIGLPIVWDRTALSIFGSNLDHSLLLTSIVTIMPISLATMMEHVGDICAISSTVGKNFVEDPGLHRTLVGDGLATTMASLFGAPANTTYGENTGVLALSKVYDPKVIRLAAVFAIVLSFCPKFAALIVAMPAATMGGVSLVLYGMISAVGVRNVVENQVDFTKSRNVLIAAMIMGLAVGVNYAGSIAIPVGSVTISLSGLAVAALVGILMNAILPGKDYEFGANEQGRHRRCQLRAAAHRSKSFPQNFHPASSSEAG